jgi:hypothetical protein
LGILRCFSDEAIEVPRGVVGDLAASLSQIAPLRSLLIDGLGPDLEVATCHAAARDEPGIFIAKHVHVVEILLARQNRSVADVLGVVVLLC